MIAAWIIWAIESGRSCLINVARTSCMSTTPMTVPRTRTRPPVSGVPPTTTAVIAESSMSSPMSAGSLAASLGGGQHARDRREHAADRVDADQHPVDRQSGEVGGPAVAADGDQLPPERRAVDQHGDQDREYHGDHHD